MEHDLRDSLEHLKKWLEIFLKQHPTVDFNTHSDAIDWMMIDIRHAIDHIITDHCEDE